MDETLNDLLRKLDSEPENYSRLKNLLRELFRSNSRELIRTLIEKLYVCRHSWSDLQYKVPGESASYFDTNYCTSCERKVTLPEND